MSSGLRAVVAATRPGVPQLRPRPVSRFESPAQAVPHNVFEPDAAAEELSHRSLPPAAEPVPPVRYRAIPRHAEVPAERGALREANQPRTHVAAAHVSPTPRADRPPPSVTAPPPARVGSNVAVQHPPQRPVALDLSAFPVAEQLKPLMARQKRDVSSVPAPAELSRRASPPPLPVHGALVAPPVPEGLTPPRTRPPETADRRSVHAGTQPAQRADPDVHVSIGRIEVHATPPAASTAAPTEARPLAGVIGLDEYLVHRSTR